MIGLMVLCVAMVVSGLIICKAGVDINESCIKDFTHTFQSLQHSYQEEAAKVLEAFNKRAKNNTAIMFVVLTLGLLLIVGGVALSVVPTFLS